MYPTTRPCAGCGGVFIPKVNNQKYCGITCRRAVYRTNGPESTDRQYALISGNWVTYFNRLCTRSFNRSGLTSAQMVDLLHKQGGKCALSGVELTCVLQKGVVSKTNASIDRISPLNDAFVIFYNQVPNYYTSVAYDAGNYKTIGSAFEFGGLQDGSSTKNELMEAILEFFGGLPTGLTLNPLQSDYPVRE